MRTLRLGDVPRATVAILSLSVLAVPLAANPQTTTPAATPAQAYGSPVDLGVMVPWEINDHGEVAGECYPESAGGEQRGCVWRDGSIEYLGVLPGGWASLAISINDREDVVGISTKGIGPDGTALTSAVLWRRGEMLDLGPLAEGAASEAFSINNSSEVTGSVTVPGPSGASTCYAATWRNGVWAKIETGVDDQCKASDSNERGELLVSTVAAVFTPDGRIDLPQGGCAAYPNGINNRGDVVGALWCEDKLHAALWLRRPGFRYELTDLGTLGGMAAEAFAINDAGDVVGTVYQPSQDVNYSAFVWNAGVLDVLTPPEAHYGQLGVSVNSRRQVLACSFGEEGCHAVVWSRTR